VTVANLYYAQPLLNELSEEFGTSEAAPLLVTNTQVG
jgi:hypothetical protein